MVLLLITSESVLQSEHTYPITPTIHVFSMVLSVTDVTEAPKAPAAESNTNTEDINIDEDEKGADLSDTEEVSDGDMVEDNFAGNNAFVAHHQSDNHLVRQVRFVTYSNICSPGFMKHFSVSHQLFLNLHI